MAESRVLIEGMYPPGTTLPISGTVVVQNDNKTTATLANVTSSVTNVTLFASSATAVGRAVYNDSTSVAYLKYGATASTTSYTVQLAAGAYYEFPQPLYAGQVDIIWTAANGAARTTQW